MLSSTLDHAFKLVNEKLDDGCRVAAAQDKKLAEKEPIFLELVQNDVRTPIGITHFAHLTKNFESAPFEEVARTVDELAASILKAIKIHKKAKENPGVLINAVGVPFFKLGMNIEILDGILCIDGRQITFNDKPLEAKRLCGEEGLVFGYAANGDVVVINPIDKREGKGIFFNKNTGAVYRG